MYSRNVLKRRIRMTWFLAAMWLVLYPASAFAQKLIFEKNSIYNNIYVYKNGPHHVLTFGHNRRFYTETIFDTRDELVLPVVYTRFMTVGLAYAQNTSRILEIGSGGGRTMWYLHKQMPDAAITTVELDPAVHDAAKAYFGVKDEKNFSFQVKDGRRYLAVNAKKWDIIFVDAYRGPFVPFHLLTTQFFELVKKRLTPGGIVVQNIEPTTMVFDAAIATIQKVFANIDIYRANGNVVAVAYNGTELPTSSLRDTAERLQLLHNFRYPIAKMLSSRLVVNKKIEHKPLTDDFAPVESLLAIERHNRKWSDFTRSPKK